MPKIVVIQNLGLNNKDKERLDRLGSVVYYDDLPSSENEWLKRCKEADIICTGKFGFKTEKLYELKNKFFSVPFVGTGFLNQQKLKENNILVSKSPGCNKEAVSEWITGMILNMFRELPEYIDNLNSPTGMIPIATKGLKGKNITILGKGNIGSRVGKIGKAFEMNVNYFTRDDDLLRSVKDADVIVNTLSHNDSTTGLLDEKFFYSLKKGSYFITVTSFEVYDIDSMIKALNDNILKGVADDCGSIQVGDVSDERYIKLANHPKIFATPHIAYHTDITDRQGSQMMIDNIEAYLNGNPINLV